MSDNAIIQRIFHTPWHFMRWFRLAIGLLAIGNTFFSKTPWNNSMNLLILAGGIYFSLQAIMGWGCLNNNCEIPEKNPRKND